MTADQSNQEPLLTSNKTEKEPRRINPFDVELGDRRNKVLNEETVRLKDANGTYYKDPDVKDQSPMQQINDAYKACGFGWFHVKLIFISFFGTLSGVLVTHSTSFLLPVAECDLKMGLIEKGLLNAAPFLGMTITSVIGGFLTDTFGRVKFLRLGFGGMFFFAALGGTSQTYEVLVTSKFFEGLLFSLAISAYVTFLSEFCYKEIRDRVMICQSSFVAVSQIISPALAWVILTQNWRYTLFNGSIVLNTWNFYVYIMSLWALASFILYCTLPESPKFLVAQGRYDEARNIIISIYKQNTGKPVETYPYKDIWRDIPVPDKTEEEKKIESGLGKRLLGGLRNAKPIFERPLIVYLLILGCINFVVLCVYNVVRLWFPQLSAIVENYGTEDNQDLCLLLDTYTNDLRKTVNVTTSVPEVCIPKISGSATYINSIIIGCVCLLPYFITGALVNKVGKKTLVVILALIGVGVNMGMRWSRSKFALVALFSVATAITQSLKGMTQAFAVEVFPTAVRSLGVSLIMLIARLGTLAGNIGFPVLLNFGCVFPFFTMSGMMLCVAVLALLISKKSSNN